MVTEQEIAEALEGQPEPVDPIARIFFVLARALGTVLVMGPSSAAGTAELLRQQDLLEQRPALLSLAEALELRRRESISDGEFANTLARGGLSNRAISALSELTETLLGVGDLVALWRRDEIGEGELDEGLKKLGYEGASAAQLKALAFEVAAPQDVIRFVVREVFSPELRSSLGLDADFPEASEDAFKAAGLKPELARDFWAAHWELPGTALAFEMFQRQEITEADLDLILRANDILPRFREPIKAVAFRPITRVDLRRIFGLGLIDEDRLVLGFRNIGFSPEDAELQAEFVKEFVKKSGESGSSETRDLTRAQILRFHKAGLFSDEETVSSLIEIGFVENDAVTMVTLQLIAADQELTDAQVNVIRARFKNGSISFNETLTALDELQVPPRERDLLLAEFEALRESEIRLPSRAEMDRFLRGQIVTVDEYLVQLRVLGYPDPWPERFAALVTSSAATEES